MTHVVAEPCFNCKYTDCVVVCPVECFYEGEAMLFIHPDECIDCEACVPECPPAAIFHEDNLPAEWADYKALNAEMAPNCPVITELRDPMGPEAVGFQRRLGFGKHFVAYHNDEKMGHALGFGRSKSTSFGTNKTPGQFYDGQVWMISGAGTPRTFRLHGWFHAEDCLETDGGDFKYSVGGELGMRLKPPVVLNDLPWFADFKKSQGSFSLGIQQIRPEFVKKLEKLEKSVSES